MYIPGSRKQSGRHRQRQESTQPWTTTERPKKYRCVAEARCRCARKRKRCNVGSSEPSPINNHPTSQNVGKNAVTKQQEKRVTPAGHPSAGRPAAGSNFRRKKVARKENGLGPVARSMRRLTETRPKGGGNQNVSSGRRAVDGPLACADSGHGPPCFS